MRYLLDNIILLCDWYYYVKDKVINYKKDDKNSDSVFVDKNETYSNCIIQRLHYIQKAFNKFNFN